MINYLPPDKGFWANGHKDDSDLEPFWVELPECPLRPLVEGYGKNAKDQKFEKEKFPERLLNLEKIIRSRKSGTRGKKESSVSIEDLRDEILDNKDEYKNEILWLKTQWYYRFNGKWIYINGKPTWLPGKYWFYLNYYYLKTGNTPEYRDKDRRLFSTIDFIYKETKDENGVNQGRPLHIGINELGKRRDGKSSRSGCLLLEEATRTLNFTGGIQGMDGNNGHDFFKEFVVFPLRKLKWWFKPLFIGSDDPEEKVEFKSTRVKIGNSGSVLGNKEGLDTKITYAGTADKSFYDKSRLNWLCIDEPGKTELENVYTRHSRVKECVAQGAGVNRIGFLYYTTTVEDSKKDAMDNFKLIVKESHYEERTNGITLSGMVNLFFAAYDGLEGFIDEYGMSKEEDAYSFLMGKRQDYIKNRNYEGLANFIRKFPFTIRECFTPASDDVLFNRKILQDRLTELANIKDSKNLLKYGNLEWTNGFGSDVMFVPKSESEGLWVLSINPDKSELNKRYKKVNNLGKSVWYPNTMSKGLVCVDIFQFGNKKSRRKSNGGAAVFLRYDVDVDNPATEVSHWKTHRFIATFQNKQEIIGTDEKMAEEGLKACIYFSMPIYPEINIKTVWSKFEEWGYDGYLYYDRIIRGGKIYMSETPGFTTTGGAMKQNLFTSGSNYLEVHGHREVHIEILRDMFDIRGIDEMTDYDRLTAVLGCLRGLDSTYGMISDYMKKTISTKIDLSKMSRGF